MNEQNEIKRVRITVAGSDYTLLSQDDAGYIKDLADTLDGALRDLTKNGSTTMSALVLTALNYLDEFNKASEDCDKLRAQVAEYASDVAKSRVEIGDVRKENERLIKEVAELKK